MSWVIVNKETNEPIFETWNKQLTLKINLKKYNVIPILEWLQNLNKHDNTKED